VSSASSGAATGRGAPIVVKVGSSSVTTPEGQADVELIARLCGEIAAVRAGGRDVVVVSSGAIAVGWSALARQGPRPTDPRCSRRCRPWASSV
jgi:glutamate 5-kinase